MNDTSLITFKAISNFITELSDVYGKKHKPLKLYHRLISKTTLSHDKAIKKHIDAFRTFCISNRQNIVDKTYNNFDPKKIEYSDRVYVDIKYIFKVSDEDTRDVIWSHILCISALVDPAGKAKEVLRKNMEDGKSGGHETEFLTNIINKVESNINTDADPMSAVSSIMNSGIFTDLIGGMQNGLQSGNLDISKLMGAVTSMVSSLGGEAGDDPQTAGAMNMLKNMTSMMGNMTGGGDGKVNPPNMQEMMSTMMSGMSGMVNSTTTVTTTTTSTTNDSQVEELDESES